MTDPYALDDSSESEGHHVFWADTVADRIEDRLDRNGADGTVVIKGGVSPSGVPHLGHANEVMRGYFVAEVLRERGHDVRQVFTSDDRDPLRKVPRTLADLEWNVVNLGDVPDPGALGRNLGKPLTAVPDPFECCGSFGEHQTELLRQSADALGVPLDVLSTTALYEEGRFDEVVYELLDRQDRAREVLADYQDKVDETYVPFNPLCEACGKLTETVTAVDFDARTVEYECTDIEAGGNTIEGCGHTGTATFREGKLPWRFEWPGQWRVLGVDFEPFGKDHAEGSWPSGKAIAREVLEFGPPTPMVYEWFTYDGEALSSSAGHVITVPEVLEMVDVEVLRYFFTKNPKKARDFDVSRLDQLVDEFDRVEGIAFDASIIGGVGDDERQRAKRVYPFVVDGVPEEQPVRVSYTFAAVLGMTDDHDLREEMARREGHIPEDASVQAVEDALARVNRARRWAERTDNAYNYRLETDLPEVEFDAETEAALDELADVVEAGHDGEKVQEEIFETARRYDRSPGDLFTAGYRLFLGTEQGPKLGPFLVDLDREFVVQRLRREG